MTDTPSLTKKLDDLYALIGGSLRDGREFEPVESRSLVVTQDAGQTAIDDAGDAFNRQRGLGNVRRENDLPPPTRLKHRILLLGRKITVELQ